MSKIESKIHHLERVAANFDAAYRALRRASCGLCYADAARKGETMVNLLRNAADAREKARELRGQLASDHPLYQPSPWQPVQLRPLRAA